MTNLIADALGKGDRLTFAGQTWTVSALDFNDLCDLETEIGSLEGLDLSTLAHQREILWMVLRKADPTLPDEYRQAGKYKMTKMDVGRLLSAQQLQKPETAAFLINVLRISGVLPRVDTEDSDPNEQPAETPANPPKRSRSASASGVTSAS